MMHYTKIIPSGHISTSLLPTITVLTQSCPIRVAHRILLNVTVTSKTAGYRLSHRNLLFCDDNCLKSSYKSVKCKVVPVHAIKLQWDMLQRTNATTKFDYNEQILSIKPGCYNEHRCYNERGGILSADVERACARRVGLLIFSLGKDCLCFSCWLDFLCFL